MLENFTNDYLGVSKSDKNLTLTSRFHLRYLFALCALIISGLICFSILIPVFWAGVALTGESTKDAIWCLSIAIVFGTLYLYVAKKFFFGLLPFALEINQSNGILRIRNYLLLKRRVHCRSIENVMLDIEYGGGPPGPMGYCGDIGIRYKKKRILKLFTYIQFGERAEALQQGEEIANLLACCLNVPITVRIKKRKKLKTYTIDSPASDCT